MRSPCSSPYRDQRKVSIFGSARIQMDDPLYDQARRLAAALAERGWMTVTGAGPGIMQAGMEGAGKAKSIGVSIRLPFESGANSVIAGDAKHVSMKYFFTRKLMLIKESQAFVCLPGGFGTLDETFELLTLTQTGKGMPVPIVLLDAPGDPYWESIDTFVRDTAHRPRARRRPRHDAVHDHRLVRDGRRGHRALLRQLPLDPLRRRQPRGPDAPGSERRAARRPRTNGSATSWRRGSIEVVEPFKAERRDDDHVDLDRIAFNFSKRGYSELITMIDVINGYV